MLNNITVGKHLRRDCRVEGNTGTITAKTQRCGVVCYFFVSQSLRFEMLHKEKKVQECDARMLLQRFEADIKKNNLKK